MKNQEEFEIIRIEKNLEREKKLAVATSTLYAISSVLSMTSGIICASNDKIPVAITHILISITFGVSSKMAANQIKDVNKRIKYLKK